MHSTLSPVAFSPPKTEEESLSLLLSRPIPFMAGIADASCSLVYSQSCLSSWDGVNPAQLRKLPLASAACGGSPAWTHIWGGEVLGGSQRLMPVGLSQSQGGVGSLRKAMDGALNGLHGDKG